MQKNHVGSATGPKTHASIKSKYNGLRNNLTQRINLVNSEINETTDTLTEMSQEMYGTPHFQEDSNFFAKHLWWIAILAVVAIIEIPLNSMAFEIFDRTQSETRWMAIGFGLFVAVIAHFTGYTFKRYTANKKTSYLIIGLACLIVSAFGLYTVAGFRVQYRAEMNMGLNMSQFAQAGFAFIIYFAGVVASFFHTSSVSNLQAEKVFNKKLESLRRLKLQLTKLNDEKTKLDLAEDKELDNFVTVVAEQAKQADLRETRELNQKEQNFKTAYHEFNSIIDRINEIVDDYKDDLTNLKLQCVIPLNEMERYLDTMKLNVTDSNQAEVNEAETLLSNLKTKYGNNE